MGVRKIGIIGGGAAGMVAAITAATSGADVTILERGDRIGKKILMTGNGKCNLGNLVMDGSMYYGASDEWLKQAFLQFGVEDTIHFFSGLGLLIKEKNSYLYPMCEQASTLLDVLRNELKYLDVTIVTECKINLLKPQDENGKILVSDGNTDYIFDKVILACGGKAAPQTGSDGSGYKLAKQLKHRIIPCVPALVQLKCREEYIKSIAGVRAHGKVSVMKNGQCLASDEGEIQFTDYGISGIPVFQISRVVNYLLRVQDEVEVRIDLLSDYTDEMYRKMCANRIMLQSDRTVEEFFSGMLHKKIMNLFEKMSGLKVNGLIREARPEGIEMVYRLCRSFTLHINGNTSYEHAQTCAGGVDTLELNENMESKLHSGIYFAGEMVDVDGKCGGYNLQWAWTSGYIAGKAAAKG